MHLSTCGLLLVVVLTLGYSGKVNSLECFTCNATVSNKEQDACKGIGQKLKCQDPSVCLSVTYIVTYLFDDPNSRSKQYTTIKSCYMKNGQECDLFEKNIKASSPTTAKIKMLECTVSSGSCIYSCGSLLLVILMQHLIRKL